MSFFNSFTNIVNSCKEFYSEINTATLTGAIDVIVIEQENGDLRSTPFHLRFGKLGVLKAREKIVDLEVNGEPVNLQMKLDDTGTAFFVENVEETEQEEVGWERPDLVTSPIPESSGFNWQDRRTGNLKPMALFPEATPANVPEPFTETVCEDSETPIESLKDVLEEAVIGTNPSRKGKLNKKKRRRRTQLRQSRRGSRVNALKDASETESTDDMFAMDDVNDADQEDETGCSETGPGNLPSLNLELVNKSFDSALVTPVSALKPQMMSNSIRNVNYQCTLVEESHIKYLQRTPEVFVGGGSQSVSADFHYFGDCVGKVEEGRESTYSGIEPGTELDPVMGAEDIAEETHWRWGELPVPSPIVQKETEIVVKKEVPEDKFEQEVEVSVKNIQSESERKKSWFSAWGGSKDVSPEKQLEPAGVFLDDIVSDPGKWAELGYLSRPVSLDQDPLDMSLTPGLEIRPREDDCESGTGPSLPMSPLSTVSSQTARYDLITSDCESEMPPSQLPCEVTRYLPDLALSLCGGLASHSITPDMFESGLLTYHQLVSQLREGDRDLVSNPRLVVRVHEKYLPWDQAAPIILAVLLFKQPLPSDVTEEILKGGLNVNINIPIEEVVTRDHGDKMEERKSSSWFRWFGSGKVLKEEIETDIKTEVVAEELTDNPQEDVNSKIETNTSTSVPGIPGRKRMETETSSSDSDALTDKKKYRKTLRLSSENLSSLGLKPGRNEVQFSVTTAFQGTTVCRCHIYLWHHTDKLVISDIDGTITRSDVFGHLLPLIGRDWTQSGVAQLFSKIKNNGYHIMYLSARAIGQSSLTKDYLQSLKQDDVCLPPGPVFLNPASLLNAVRREVIDRNPEEFKIQCLKDIQSLFEGKQPFFAGYGNRPNDAYAYKNVGISEARIFTINPAGELSLSLTPAQNFQTSYSGQDSMVDMVFPPLGSQVDDFDPEFELQKFSSFGFWRARHPELKLSAELSRMLT